MPESKELSFEKLLSDYEGFLQQSKLGNDVIERKLLALKATIHRYRGVSQKIQADIRSQQQHIDLFSLLEQDPIDIKALGEATEQWQQLVAQEHEKHIKQQYSSNIDHLVVPLVDEWIEPGLSTWIHDAQKRLSKFDDLAKIKLAQSTKGWLFSSKKRTEEYLTITRKYYQKLPEEKQKKLITEAFEPDNKQDFFKKVWHEYYKHVNEHLQKPLAYRDNFSIKEQKKFDEDISLIVSMLALEMYGVCGIEHELAAVDELIGQKKASQANRLGNGREQLTTAEEAGGSALTTDQRLTQQLKEKKEVSWDKSLEGSNESTTDQGKQLVQERVARARAWGLNRNSGFVQKAQKVHQRHTESPNPQDRDSVDKDLSI